MSVVYNSNLIMLRKINDQSANVMQRQLINLSVNYFWACIFPMIGHFRSVRKEHWNPNVFFCAHFAHSAVFNCLYCIQYTVNVSQRPITKIQSSSISQNLQSYYDRHYPKQIYCYTNDLCFHLYTGPTRLLAIFDRLLNLTYEEI